MRSVGLPELLIVWLVFLALPALVLFFLWRSYRILSRICEHAAAIRRALEREERP